MKRTHEAGIRTHHSTPSSNNLGQIELRRDYPEEVAFQAAVVSETQIDTAQYLYKDLHVASWVAAWDRLHPDTPASISHIGRKHDMIWLFLEEGGATVVSRWQYRKFWKYQQERHPELKDYQPIPTTLPAVDVVSQEKDGNILSGIAKCNGVPLKYRATLSFNDPPVVDCGDPERTKRLALQWHNLRGNDTSIWWDWNLLVPSAPSFPPGEGWIEFPDWKCDAAVAGLPHAEVLPDRVIVGTATWFLGDKGVLSNGTHFTIEDIKYEAVFESMRYRPLPLDYADEF